MCVYCLSGVSIILSVYSQFYMEVMEANNMLISQLRNPEKTDIRRHMNECWLYRLPEDVLSLIYDYDSTYREVYQRVVNEFLFVIEYDFYTKTRVQYYENYSNYSVSAKNGIILNPLYGGIHDVRSLSSLSSDKCNIITRMEFRRMKYDYLNRQKKRECLRIINEHRNLCNNCSSAVSPARYTFRYPFSIHLFCSYQCHLNYYLDFDYQKNNINQTSIISTRPVFHPDTGNAEMEECHHPNIWHLRPDTEQWEIIWINETPEHNRDRRIYV